MFKGNCPPPPPPLINNTSHSGQNVSLGERQVGSFPEMYNDIQRQPGFQIGVDRKGSSLFSEPCASLCTDAPSPKKISGIFSEGRGCLHTGQRNSNIMQINGFAAGPPCVLSIYCDSKEKRDCSQSKIRAARLRFCQLRRGILDLPKTAKPQ